MAYTSVKLKYYNGGQYNKSVVLHNTTDDFIKFCKMIRLGQFIPPARKQAYSNNLDNFIMWLDSQYANVDFVLNNIFDNMFRSGVDITNLISVLTKDTATEKDFNELNII